MKTLLLDLGNTRWKATTSESGRLGTVYAAAYDDTAALARLHGIETEGAISVLLASVLDTARTNEFVSRLKRNLNLPIRQIVSTDEMPNVTSGYRKPEQLGVDRLLAMVAARAETSHPLCVVDAGTATTVDFVDRDGNHCGGFIVPGLRLYRDCLLANTSIPRDAEPDPSAMLGIDTPSAVALGARYAVAGLVERFTCGSAALFGNDVVETFVGGGDADAIVDLIPGSCHKLNELVLRGLSVVATVEGAV